MSECFLFPGRWRITVSLAT